MSHFVVGVITHRGADYDYLEEMLAPYDENCDVEFRDTEQEHFQEYREGSVEMYRTPDGDLISRWSKLIPTEPDEESPWMKKFNIPEDWVKIDVPYTVIYPTFIDYLKAYEDIDETGKCGYWYNPNAKWDWWVIGGRWDGYFDGANTINVKDYDTSIDLESYNKHLQMWEEWENGKEFSIDEDYELGMYKRDYIKNFYSSARIYARIKALPWMRAVITPDGEWHEVGEMGAFGCSDETGEDARHWADNFVKDFILPYSNGEYEITVVDCHI